MGRSDDVIFQIHDGMLALFSKAVAAGKDYTLVSVSNHNNTDSPSIFGQSRQAAKSADISLILVDSLDWRNMKILRSLQTESASPCVHLLLNKDGKIVGRLDKPNPTPEEIDAFIKASISSSSQS